jgi:hypothetical protein
MTEARTIDYQFLRDTIPDLARSLIIASTLHSGPQPFHFPLTSQQALVMGRALEGMADAEARLAEAVTTADAALDVAIKNQRQATESVRDARKILGKAQVLHVASLIWCLISVAAWWAL